MFRRVKKLLAEVHIGIGDSSIFKATICKLFKTVKLAGKLRDRCKDNDAYEAQMDEKYRFKYERLIISIEQRCARRRLPYQP